MVGLSGHGNALLVGCPHAPRQGDIARGFISSPLRYAARPKKPAPAPRLVNRSLLWRVRRRLSLAAAPKPVSRKLAASDSFLSHAHDPARASCAKTRGQLQSRPTASAHRASGARRMLDSRAAPPPPTAPRRHAAISHPHSLPQLLARHVLHHCENCSNSPA